MNRILKIVLGLVAAVVLLMVAAAVLLPMLYDTEDLKRTIYTQVAEQTGRELDIAGELSFSVFPYVAVEVNDLSLSNPPGFGDEPFAQVGQARVGVALMPLTRKELIVDEVLLTGMSLDLVVKADGSTNWDDLAGGSQPDTPSDESPFTDQSIAGLNIQDAEIEFQDAQAGTHYRLSGFDLQTGALGGSGPVPFTMHMVLEDIAAQSRLEVGMAAEAAFDMDQELYSFRNVSLDVSADGEPVRIEAPELTANLASDTLSLDSFTAHLAGLVTTGSLKARDITGEPAFTGVLQVSEFSPAEVIASMGMEPLATTDPGVMQRARLNATIEGSTNRLVLKGLEMDLDDSKLSGDFRVRDFNAPKVRFELNVDAIDLDRYMAPASGETGEDEDVAMPKDELKGITVQGTLRVTSLRAMGLDLTDAEVGVKVADSRLRLNPLTAGFYGGKYQGNIVLDASGDTPTISLNEKLDSVVFRDLAGDLLGKENISGEAFGRVKLSGQGKTSSEVLGSLTGDVSLNLDEGALEGVNVWYEVRRAYAMFKGQPAPEAEEDRTVFSKMIFDAAVQDGVMNTRELVGQLPFLDINGDGKINLADQSLDLDLVAAVRDVPELAQDPLAADLKGKKVPFTIKGSLAEPKVGVDVAGLLKGEATDKLLEKIGVSSEDGDGSLEDVAGSLLGGLLGGDDEDEDEKKKKRKKKREQDEGGG